MTVVPLKVTAFLLGSPKDQLKKVGSKKAFWGLEMGRNSPSNPAGPSGR